MENIKKNSLNYEREDLDINDSNFLKIVSEKVEYYKKCFLYHLKKKSIVILAEWIHFILIIINL